MSILANILSSSHSTVWPFGDGAIPLTYFLVTVFCTLSGAVLCTLFATSQRLREQRGARLAGALGVLSGIGLYLVALSSSEEQGTTIAVLSVVALSGHTVLGTYLAIRASVEAIRTLTTRLPGADRSRTLLRPSLAGYQRLYAERCRELELRPTDAGLRKELFEILLELGEHRAALYHGYTLIELLPQGPAHGLALYRLSQTLVDQLNRLEEAQPHLRRIIRLYPRSFFASYARRLVNHYEAYADREH